MDFVKNRLLNEDLKRQEQSGNEVNISQSSKAFVSNTNKQFKCWICQELGHGKWDCPNKPKKKDSKIWKKKQAHLTTEDESDDTDNRNFAFLSYKNKEYSSNNLHWYLDSGASDHLINNKHYFNSIEELKYHISIGVAKTEQDLKGEFVGAVSLFQLLNGKKNNFNLQNVIYVPELRNNLLSVGRIEQSDLRVVFTKGQAKILHDGTVIAIGNRKGLFTKLFSVSMIRQLITVIPMRIFNYGTEDLITLIKNTCTSLKIW